MRYRYRVFWIILIFMATAIVAQGQFKISGRITNSKKVPIQDAIVTITEHFENIVLAYAITDEKGKYSIIFHQRSQSDSFLIRASLLNHIDVSKLILGKPQEIDFVLIESEEKLPAITVKANRQMIRVYGDTLSYDVQSFSNPQDRVIADVIKRLPGVEVTKEGMILYQGKPLSHFYIDGDDLLNGKYSLATQNLPNVLVDKIEVLENHQPVRILKGVINTDKPAMNLVLYDSSRLRIIGEGGIQLGTSGTYEGVLNAMSFKKKVKFINLFKLNNAGINLANEIISHTRTSYNTNIPNILNVDVIGNPNLSEPKYFRNNSKLGTANVLFNLRNEVKVKLNLFYLSDKQYKDQSGFQSINTIADTFYYVENNHFQVSPKSLKAEFNINANKSNYYFDDLLVIEKSIKPGIANLNSKFYSGLTLEGEREIKNISNQIMYRGKFKNWIGEWFSFVGKNNDYQTLLISPGIHNYLINTNKPYEQLVQDLNISSVSFDNHLKFYNSRKLINNSFQAGFITRSQDFKSILYRTDSLSSISKLPKEYQNDFNYQYSKAYLETSVDLKLDRLQISVKIPLEYETVAMSDNIKTITPAATFQKSTFYPSVGAKFQINENHVINADFAPSRGLATFLDLYSGYLLTNYRQFNRNVLSEVPQYFRNGLSAIYSFRNTRKLFFSNSGFIYSRSNRNVVSNTLLNDSIQFSQATIYPGNKMTTLSFFNTTSKYLFKIRTTIGLKTSWQQMRTLTIQNGRTYFLTTHSASYNISLRSKFFNWVNTEYSFQLLRSVNNTSIENQVVRFSQHTKQIQQKLDLDLVVSKNVGTIFSLEHYLAESPGLNKTENVFADISIFWKPPKVKYDLRIAFTNIFNNDVYSSILMSQNSMSYYTFRIRPRIFSIRYSFHL